MVFVVFVVLDFSSSSGWSTLFFSEEQKFPLMRFWLFFPLKHFHDGGVVFVLFLFVFFCFVLFFFHRDLPGWILIQLQGLG